MLAHSGGDLRDPVTFQRLGVAGDDGYGNVDQSWTDLFTDRCNLRETPGREAIAAGALEAATTGTLRVRRSTQTLGLTAADRAVCRGFTWQIRSAPAQVGQEPGFLEMIVQRGVAL